MSDVYEKFTGNDLRFEVLELAKRRKPKKNPAN